MPVSEVSVYTAQPYSWYTHKIRLLFQMIATTHNQPGWQQPIVPHNHSMANKMHIRLMLQGQRDGVKGLTFLTRVQAEELGHALLEMASQMP